MFCSWNPESWDFESRIEFKESGILERLQSGIQVSLTKNLESST